MQHIERDLLGGFDVVDFLVGVLALASGGGFPSPLLFLLQASSFGSASPIGPSLAL